MKSRKAGHIDKRLSYTQFLNSKGGATLYVGSRHSQFCGRFYDKGIESGQAAAGKILRYEVEIKKPASTKVASVLLGDILAGEASQEEITKYVFHWFMDRGVTPLFKAVGSPYAIEIGAKLETTNERKLRWLRTQVAPTVVRLLECGLREEISAALGFYVGDPT
jgi:DNA relaxase NicK